MRFKNLIKLICEENEKRIDKFLAKKLPQFTRSSFLRLFFNKNVTLNGKTINKSTSIKAGDIIEILVPEPQKLKIEAQNIPLDVVFEDKDVIVVNKIKGMVVHPSNGHIKDTLVNALLFHCRGSLSSINGIIRPGIVHRIDKDTSGLLVVAKNNDAHLKLAEQVKRHAFCREYEAIVYGVFEKAEGTISLPICRSRTDRKKMAVMNYNSKPATTHFKVLKNFKTFSHIKLILETGRTHQIRVHMAYIGHPVAGDAVYGPKKVIKELNGQCLHAKKLGFVHPNTNEYMEFNTDLPKYFKKFLKRLIEFNTT